MTPTVWSGVADPALVRGLAGVRVVEPNAKVFAQATVPNDPCVTTCNGGQSEWYLGPVGASSAFDRSKGDGVTIAILDSGIDTTHPDLSSKVIGSADFTTVHDGNGTHGTEVAGVAGAATNNGVGVASVGWNVNLLSVKVLDASGAGDTDWVVAGIDYAITHGAKVVNMSLAGTQYVQALQDEITKAYTDGVLVVAAAGNNDDPGGQPTDPKYPAAMDHVLSVAATQTNDTIASFSRRGPTVDIAAPGVSLETTQTGSTYGPASGTSLAAPLVSAAAALLIAQNFGVETSPDAVTAQLIHSGVPISNGSGGIIRRLQIGTGTQTAAPYGLDFGGGDSVAVGDLDTNTPGEEIVTAAGPGGGPHVRMYSAAMNPLPTSFYAYGKTFSGGVEVAVGDVLTDSPGNEIVTATGPGGGPHVEVFTAQGQLLDSFMAFNPGFSGGITVAVGDFDNGLNGEEIAVGAGPGGGPQVNVFHADGSQIGTGFYVYDAAFTGGVRVASAQVDGSGADEIITTPRSGGGPHVRAFHVDHSPIGAGIFAFDASVSPGLAVAAGATEVVVGTRGKPALTRAFPLNALT